MPVRSSLCTYSPSAAIGSSATSSPSKYSAILPTTSSLSYGHYKPIGSSSTSASSQAASSGYRSSFKSSTPSHEFTSSTLSSPGSRTSSFASRYSLNNSSLSSYSPVNSASYQASSASSLASGGSGSSSSSTGLYRPLDSSAQSSRYGSSLKASGAGRSSAAGAPYSSSSSSSNSLSSATHHDTYHSSAYKSPSSASTSSAYSSAGSRSSLASASRLAGSSSPRGRRLSHTVSVCYLGRWPTPAGGRRRVPRPLGRVRRLLFSSIFSRRRATQLVRGAPKRGAKLTQPTAALPLPTHQQHMQTSASLASRRSSSALTESAAVPLEPGVPGGLMNLGNTCYMNASLQSIYAIESLRELLLSSRLRSSDKVLASQLADLFTLMKSGAGGTQPVSPADFKYAFSRYQSKFSGFAQQDAQEFLRYLINGVHEEFNRAGPKARPAGGRPAARAPKSAQEAWAQYREIVDDSPLVELLVGQLCSTITCGECGNKSHCWDPFWDLSLPLPGRRSAGGSSASSYLGSPSSYSSRGSCSLRDVIEEFTSKETLDDDVMCGQCKRATKSTKQISWSRLPQVMILHLKKFTNDGYKLSSTEIQIDRQLTFNGKSYQLKACISHHGHSSCSGHYTSHCQYNGRWYHFDDSRVRDVTSTFDTGKLNDAYVLLYTPGS